MHFSIDPRLKQICPALELGVVQGSVSVSKSGDALVQLLRERARELARNGGVSSAVSGPEVMATREAYKRLGKDPSRYRGSAEALLRRVSSGKDLYFINNVVDINNLVSLESFLPVGSYDVGKLTGEVIFRTGKEGETYKGIGKDVINIADLPVFADSLGPFGSPTSDSERAMITPATQQLGMVLISFGGQTDLEKWAARAIALLQQHAQGSDLSFAGVR